MFVQDAFDVTEVHLHSFVSCGSPCHFARVETIVFFDEGEENPIYDRVDDTIPNEYPSRWFRSFLNGSERAMYNKAN